MRGIRITLPLIRKQHRLSQRQLAALAGVRPDTISALERGKSTGIQFETLASICEALNCKPGDLFELELDDHEVPVLGGPDEDEILLRRLRNRGRIVDGASFVAELMKQQQEHEGHVEDR